MNSRKLIAITASFALGILFMAQGVWASDADNTTTVSTPEQVEEVETETENELPEDPSGEVLAELIIDELVMDDSNSTYETESELLTEETETCEPLIFIEEDGIQEVILQDAELLMPQNVDAGPGDMNQSGKVDINDVQFLYEQMIRYQNGKITQEEACAYDLDGDQDLTDADISCLLQKM